MALEKQTVIDQITVVEDGHIWCRERIDIVEDGVILAKSYHRRVFIPGGVIEGNQRLKDIAAVVHTPEVIADFEEAVRLGSLDT